jgi:hypothetical protein
LSDKNLPSEREKENNRLLYPAPIEEPIVQLLSRSNQVIENELTSYFYTKIANHENNNGSNIS